MNIKYKILVNSREDEGWNGHGTMNYLIFRSLTFEIDKKMTALTYFTVNIHKCRKFSSEESHEGSFAY